MSSRPMARSKLRTTQGSMRNAQKGENILDVRGDLSWGKKDGRSGQADTNRRLC